MKFLRQSVSERRELILNGNALNTLLILSLPTVLMSLVGSIIPIIDGIALNRTSEVIVASAVGLSAPVINILNSLSAGLSVAAMAVIGQLNGQGNIKKIRKVAAQILLFSVILSICLMPGTLIGAQILKLYVSPQEYVHIFKYLSLYTPVVPMLFMAAIYNAIKQATGQPEATFVRIIILLGCKIFFNFIFLFLLDLEESGAAAASICSYVLITIWMYYDLFIKNSETQLSFNDLSFNKDLILPVIKLGIPSMLNSMLINLGFFLINMEIVKYGENIVNAQIIASNINSLCFTLPSSISSTITTMVSMNIGLGHKKKAKKIFYLACLISLILSAVLILLMNIFDDNIIRMFRSETEIVRVTKDALNIYTWSIIPFGLFSIIQGTFVAFGRTGIPLIAGFFRIWFFRYFFIILTQTFLSYRSVFFGNLFSNSISAVLLFIFLLKTPWESVIKDDENNTTKMAKPIFIPNADRPTSIRK